MDILSTFQKELELMIDKFSLNVTVSGVAEIVTEKKQHLLSASLIVSGSEPIPLPSEEDVANVMAIMKRFECVGFQLKALQFIRALFKDEKLLRWQVQYAVECVEKPEMA